MQVFTATTPSSIFCPHPLTSMGPEDSNRVTHQGWKLLCRRVLPDMKNGANLLVGFTYKCCWLTKKKVWSSSIGDGMHLMELPPIVNRPGVPGAVLQTASSSTEQVSEWSFSARSSKQQNTQTVRTRELNFWENVYPTPCVTCHLSPALCKFFFYKKKKIDREGPLKTDPPLTSSASLSKRQRRKKVICDTQHLTCDTWHMKCDTLQMVGGVSHKAYP